MEDFVKSTQKDMYQQELGNYTNRWRQNCKCGDRKKMETDWTKINTWDKVESNESTVYLRYTEELLQESVDANKRTW